MKKRTSISIIAIAFALSMPVVSHAELNLPNGNVVFDGFDNPAPGDAHPSLPEALGGKRSENAPTDNTGAWEAHMNSDKIDCDSCPDPDAE
jgi:hypothetical protein